MSIKPVDFQIMIPRAMEAAKISSNETQRNLAAQQQQVLDTQHRAEDSLKQVYSRTQAQNARITEKQKENRKNGEKGRKSGDKAENNEENGHNKLDHEIKTSTIDIKI